MRVVVAVVGRFAIRFQVISIIFKITNRRCHRLISLVRGVVGFVFVVFSCCWCNGRGVRFSMLSGAMSFIALNLFFLQNFLGILHVLQDVFVTFAVDSALRIITLI